MGTTGNRRGVQRPVVMVEGGRKLLRVGGVIQSIAVDERYTPDIWDAMLPVVRPDRALILGMGGGTMATLLTRKWPDLPITGVEFDPAVAGLAQHEFGLAACPNVHIVVADAFVWLEGCTERYDAICVDLYTGGNMAHGVLGVSFLRDVERALTAGGTVTFNLWHSRYLDDQLRRLGRVFSVQERVDVDQNVVLRCVRR